MANNFPIKPEQFRAYAEKAVNGYIKRFSKLFSPDDREDIISEVVMRMWRARDSFSTDKGAFSTWVGTIARNTVFSFAKSKKDREDISNDFEDGEILDNCEYSWYRSDEFAADRELLSEEFQEGLFGKLRSERDQRFLAWQIEGLEAKEMAKREGVSLENVYLILFHMRERLRRAA